MVVNSSKLHVYLYTSCVMSALLFDRAGVNYLLHLSFGLFFLISIFAFFKNFILEKDFGFYIILSYLVFIACYIFSGFKSYDLNFVLTKVITLSILLLFLVCTILISKDYKKYFESTLFAFYVYVLINFLIGIGVIPEKPHYFDSWRLQGTRDNPNYLAIESIFCIAFTIFYLRSALMINSLSQKKVLAANIMIILSLVVIILTGSKKGILVGAVFFVYICAIQLPLIMSLKNIKSFFISSLTILLVMYYVFFLSGLNVLDKEIILKVLIRFNEFFTQTGTSTIERLEFFKNGLGIFSDAPIFGDGFGNFYRYYGTYSHSNVVEILSGGGIITFLAYYTFAFILLAKLIASKTIPKKNDFYLLLIAVFILDFAAVTYYSKSNFILIFTIYCQIKYIESVNNKNRRTLSKRFS